MKPSIYMNSAKRTLAITWFIWGGGLFLVLFLQTINGLYRDTARDIWSWFSPTILPTAALIIGVMVSDAMGNNVSPRKVSRFAFTVTLILTIVYLITISLVILFPLSKESPSLLERIKVANFGLGPFQGIVSASLGIFFTKKSKTE